MIASDSFYMDVCKINIAHEFTLDAENGCEYPSGRGHYGLVYCLEGNAEYRFASGEKCRVGSGELLLLTPAAAYSIVIHNKFRHYTVNFDIHEEGSYTGFLKSSFCFLHSENPDQYRQSFKKLTSVRFFEHAGAQMLALSCLYELLSCFFAEIYDREHVNDRHTRLLPAKEYIDKDPSRPISLGKLACICNMSTTNFRREWMKIYGETPLRYRDKIRLFYAKELLMSGYYTVSEVAERCGFDDLSYFIRFFKKHTGLSPKKFVERQY